MKLRSCWLWVVPPPPPKPSDLGKGLSGGSRGLGKGKLDQGPWKMPLATAGLGKGHTERANYMGHTLTLYGKVACTQRTICCFPAGVAHGSLTSNTGVGDILYRDTCRKNECSLGLQGRCGTAAAIMKNMHALTIWLQLLLAWIPFVYLFVVDFSLGKAMAKRLRCWQLEQESGRKAIKGNKALEKATALEKADGLEKPESPLASKLLHLWASGSLSAVLNKLWCSLSFGLYGKRCGCCHPQA